MEMVFVPDFSADPFKAKLVINRLREEVASFEKFLLVIIKEPVRVEGDQDSFGLVLFFVFLRFDSGLFFCPGENAIPVCGELPGEIFKGAEFTDRFGSAFPSLLT